MILPQIQFEQILLKKAPILAGMHQTLSNIVS